MTSQRRDPNCRSRLNGQEPRVRALPITVMTAQGVDRVGARERHAAAVLRLSGSGMKRLDPEVVAQLGVDVHERVCLIKRALGEADAKLHRSDGEPANIAAAVRVRARGL